MRAARPLVTAAGFAVLAYLAVQHLLIDGVGAFWPASGWALAMLLLFGRVQALGVLGGALFAMWMAGLPAAPAILAATGAGAGALAGHAILTRHASFNTRLDSMRDYFRLAVQAGVLSAITSAVIGVSSFTLFGRLPMAAYGDTLAHWFLADTLGILVVTPLLLVWLQPRAFRMEFARWLEVLACVGLAAVFGQIIFLDALPQLLPVFPRKGYWLFPLLIWAAIRLDGRATTVLLAITTAQGMLSVPTNTGFFANDSLDARLIDSWLFLATLNLTGMLMAIYKASRNAAEADLRIAAIAFECQEGIIITDAQRRILRTNQSFTRIMGYSPEEVVGKTTEFMRSDRHPASFYSEAWKSAEIQGAWHAEVWHRRKNGEIFPQWLTATAVTNDQGEITNYVVTHTDFTYRKQQEDDRQVEQVAQRDALVREVHHRIKNSLQGITGVLRLFTRSNPQVEPAISHAISLVKSIAVLHGLQGRKAMEAVRLCDLTRAIADDIRTVWNTPIWIDIPDLWKACTITPSETVPVALVLSELLVNAIKHGGRSNGFVGLTLSKGGTPDTVRIVISNEGVLPAEEAQTRDDQTGMKLVHTLMPREGATLHIEQLGKHVLTRLEFSPPVVSLEEQAPD